MSLSHDDNLTDACTCVLAIIQNDVPRNHPHSALFSKVKAKVIRYLDLATHTNQCAQAEDLLQEITDDIRVVTDILRQEEKST